MAELPRPPRQLDFPERRNNGNPLSKLGMTDIPEEQGMRYEERKEKILNKLDNINKRLRTMEGKNVEEEKEEYLDTDNENDEEHKEEGRAIVSLKDIPADNKTARLLIRRQAEISLCNGTYRPFISTTRQQEMYENGELDYLDKKIEIQRSTTPPLENTTEVVKINGKPGPLSVISTTTPLPNGKSTPIVNRPTGPPTPRYLRDGRIIPKLPDGFESQPQPILRDRLIKEKKNLEKALRILKDNPPLHYSKYRNNKESIQQWKSNIEKVEGEQIKGFEDMPIENGRRDYGGDDEEEEIEIIEDGTNEPNQQGRKVESMKDRMNRERLVNKFKGRVIAPSDGFSKLKQNFDRFRCKPMIPPIVKIVNGNGENYNYKESKICEDLPNIIEYVDKETMRKIDEKDEHTPLHMHLNKVQKELDEVNMTIIMEESRKKCNEKQEELEEKLENDNEIWDKVEYLCKKYCLPFKTTTTFRVDKEGNMRCEDGEHVVIDNHGIIHVGDKQMIDESLKVYGLKLPDKYLDMGDNGEKCLNRLITQLPDTEQKDVGIGGSVDSDRELEDNHTGTPINPTQQKEIEEYKQPLMETQNGMIQAVAISPVIIKQLGGKKTYETRYGAGKDTLLKKIIEGNSELYEIANLNENEANMPKELYCDPEKGIRIELRMRRDTKLLKHMYISIGRMKDQLVQFYSYDNREAIKSKISTTEFAINLKWHRKHTEKIAIECRQLYDTDQEIQEAYAYFYRYAKFYHEDILFKEIRFEEYNCKVMNLQTWYDTEEKSARYDRDNIPYHKPIDKGIGAEFIEFNSKKRLADIGMICKEENLAWRLFDRNSMNRIAKICKDELGEREKQIEKDKKCDGKLSNCRFNVTPFIRPKSPGLQEGEVWLDLKGNNGGYERHRYKPDLEFMMDKENEEGTEEEGEGSSSGNGEDLFDRAVRQALTRDNEKKKDGDKVYTEQELLGDEMTNGNGTRKENGKEQIKEGMNMEKDKESGTQPSGVIGDRMITDVIPIETNQTKEDITRPTSIPAAIRLPESTTKPPKKNRRKPEAAKRRPVDLASQLSVAGSDNNEWSTILYGASRVTTLKIDKQPINEGKNKEKKNVETNKEVRKDIEMKEQSDKEKKASGEATTTQVEPTPVEEYHAILDEPIEEVEVITSMEEAEKLLDEEVQGEETVHSDKQTTTETPLQPEKSHEPVHIDVVDDEDMRNSSHPPTSARLLTQSNNVKGIKEKEPDENVTEEVEKVKEVEETGQTDKQLTTEPHQQQPEKIYEPLHIDVGGDAEVVNTSHPTTQVRLLAQVETIEKVNEQNPVGNVVEEVNKVTEKPEEQQKEKDVVSDNVEKVNDTTNDGQGLEVIEDKRNQIETEEEEEEAIGDSSVTIGGSPGTVIDSPIPIRDTPAPEETVQADEETQEEKETTPEKTENETGKITEENETEQEERNTEQEQPQDVLNEEEVADHPKHNDVVVEEIDKVIPEVSKEVDPVEEEPIAPVETPKSSKTRSHKKSPTPVDIAVGETNETNEVNEMEQMEETPNTNKRTYRKRKNNIEVVNEVDEQPSTSEPTPKRRRQPRNDLDFGDGMGVNSSLNAPTGGRKKKEKKIVLDMPMKRGRKRKAVIPIDPVDESVDAQRAYVPTIEVINLDAEQFNKQLMPTVGGGEEEEIEVKPEVDWVAPAPISKTTRQSRKKVKQHESHVQMTPEEIKQEIADGIEDAEGIQCVSKKIVINYSEPKVEPDEVMVVNAEFVVEAGVQLNPPEKDQPPLRSIPQNETNITHADALASRVNTAIDRLFRTDPIKFTQLLTTLWSDTKEKGDIYKMNLESVNFDARYPDELYKHFMTCKKYNDNHNWTKYTEFMEEYRNRKNKMLAADISPSKMFRDIESLLSSSTINTEYFPTEHATRYERMSFKELIERMHIHWAESVFKMVDMFDVVWANPEHSKRRMKLLHDGFCEFIRKGGVFRLYVLEQQSNKSLNPEFRQICKNTIMKIDECVNDVRQWRHYSNDEIYQQMIINNNLSEELVKEVEEDMKTEKTDTHNLHCSTCRFHGQVTIYFSSHEIKMKHVKFHGDKECSTCFTDEMTNTEMSAHTVIQHGGLLNLRE